MQLDSDMLVLRNMDELMELELDPPSAAGKGDKVFAASHACVCNPLKKPHYPKDWYVHEQRVGAKLTEVPGYLRIALSRRSTTSPTTHRKMAHRQHSVSAYPTAVYKW